MSANGNSEGVQAIVVNQGSFVGVAANQPCAGNVVTLLADGDVTFKFIAGDKTLTGMKGGMSFVAAYACTGVTSTAAVLVS